MSEDRKKPPQQDDAELAFRYAAGDPQALGALMILHRDSLVKLAHRFRLGKPDQDAAEDVVQDLYPRLANAHSTFNPNKAPWLTWVATVLRNLILARLRHDERCILTSEMEAEPDQTDATLELIISAERRDAIGNCISKLTDRNQKLIALRYFSGLSVRAIAHIVNAPQNQVTHTFRMILSQLKDCLKSLMDEP